ncbi:MAG TPA: DUF4337 family protein [Gemmataceae bacterium]|nr:DUF4337 family protein [Gemmataceae bacterium]
MTHGPEHHIEHAEHAVHASHDEFNKRVTMSIAIVAAVLACVTMLGHRAHNETLLLQGEALRVQAEALRFQTLATRESANAGKQWQYYGTKNLFNFESEAMLDQLGLLAGADASKLNEVREKYKGYTNKYGKKLPEEKAKGDAIEAKVDEHVASATEKLAEYEKTIAKVHEVHEKANRFDYGELGLQFGVVLCSLAILTKGRGLWIIGLAAAAVGALIALSGQFGLFMGHH